MIDKLNKFMNKNLWIIQTIIGLISLVIAIFNVYRTWLLYQLI